MFSRLHPVLHAWLAAVVLLLAGGPLALAAESIDTPLKVVTLDWTIAETLIAMGEPPYAAGELRSYQDWVRVPPMPDSVLDLGMRAQPNLEQLQRIAPDLIINSGMFASLTPILEEQSRVEVIDLYPPGVNVWQSAVDTTLEIGNLIGRPAKAAALIQRSTQRLEQARADLGGNPTTKVAVVQFIDARHVRIYGRHSVFTAALQRLGLQNAWSQTGNRWGFQTIGLDALARLDGDTVLVVVKPYPANVPALLEKNQIWIHLPVVENNKILVLDAVWAFGGLATITHFGVALKNGLLRLAGGGQAGGNPPGPFASAS